tara:strand:+ start:290 stop:454 length:165 start_codon:yes stop_codon:yes gene_type:complete
LTIQARNQDEIRAFEGITLMDVVLRMAGRAPWQSDGWEMAGRELLAMTRAARYW